jgi:hypothetical protein
MTGERNEPSTETDTDASDENAETIDDTDRSQDSDSSGDELGENPTREDDGSCLGWGCPGTGDSDVSNGTENSSQTDGRPDETGGSESTSLLA